MEGVSTFDDWCRNLARYNITQKKIKRRYFNVNICPPRIYPSMVPEYIPTHVQVLVSPAVEKRLIKRVDRVPALWRLALFHGDKHISTYAWNFTDFKFYSSYSFDTEDDLYRTMKTEIDNIRNTTLATQSVLAALHQATTALVTTNNRAVKDIIPITEKLNKTWSTADVKQVEHQILPFLFEVRSRINTVRNQAKITCAWVKAIDKLREEGEYVDYFAPPRLMSQ